MAISQFCSVSIPDYKNVNCLLVLPEQLNIKAVTGACKLIDGCRLELCSATPLVVSYGICHGNKVNLTARIYRDVHCHEIVSVTFTFTFVYILKTVRKH